jgi:hypothetical protein
MKNNKNQSEFFYQTLLKSLDTAMSILQIGKSYAFENNKEEEILNAKLAEDMFSFTRQIQMYTDNVKSAVLRLSGKEMIMIEDAETSFDELIHRVNKVKEIVLSVSPKDLEESADLQIKFNWMPENMSISGFEFMQNYSLQNTFFHLVIAYAILRKEGVPLKKSDYLVGVDYTFT